MINSNFVFHMLITVKSILFILQCDLKYSSRENSTE